MSRKGRAGSIPALRTKPSLLLRDAHGLDRFLLTVRSPRSAASEANEALDRLRLMFGGKMCVTNRGGNRSYLKTLHRPLIKQAIGSNAW